MVEAEAADNDIGTVVTAEGFFDLAGLGVGAVEDGGAGVGIPIEVFVDLAGNVKCFVFAVEGFVNGDLIAAVGGGPEGFAFALNVVGNDGTRGVEDILGRAIVLFEADNLRAGVVLFEI